MSAELTTTETRLVERYVWVLDLASRCAQGLDAGDWYYLADKATDLERRAGALAEVAGEIAQAVRDGRRRPRTQVVRAAVAHDGRHYRAGRLLHPHPAGGGGLMAANVRRAGKPYTVEKANGPCGWTGTRTLRQGRLPVLVMAPSPRCGGWVEPIPKGGA